MPIESRPSRESDHFTVITMNDLRVQPRGRTLNKIRDHLASIYRVLIAEDVVKIRLTTGNTATELTYEPPELLRAPFYLRPKEPPTLWRQEFAVDFTDRKATGATWATTTFIANRITTLAVSPDGQKVMLHHLPTGQIWVSTNGGMTFPADAAPTATSTELVSPLSLGSFVLSDNSHGLVATRGVAGAISSQWCSSTNLVTWACAAGPGDAHIVSGGFPVASTVTANGQVWVASPRGIGRVK